jgi:hypothetical protein
MTARQTIPLLALLACTPDPGPYLEGPASTETSETGEALELDIEAEELGGEGGGGGESPPDLPANDGPAVCLDSDRHSCWLADSILECNPGEVDACTKHGPRVCTEPAGLCLVVRNECPHGWIDACE